MITDFASLGLPDALQGNLASLGYEAMTPIQAASLPLILGGSDVIGQARTGSGKTAAFGLGILAGLSSAQTAVHALVLCPTRELAEQTTGELRRLARAMPNVRVLPVCGGAQLSAQKAALEHGVDIVVGTPGRVLEHLEKGWLRLEGLRVLVLDEADRMLDMGFLPSIQSVLKFAPGQRQTLLFSATFSEPVRALSRGYQSNPTDVTVDLQEPERQIDETFFRIEDNAGVPAVLALLARHSPESTLIFCNLKADCQRLLDALNAAGINAAVLNGDMSQQDREHMLLLFANKSCSVLVATDVAARGLDIKDLALVINFELSNDVDVHKHRIGRTGRAGQNGRAFSLFTARQQSRVLALEAQRQSPLRFEGLPPPAPARIRLIPPTVTLILAAGRREKLRPADILGELLTAGGSLPGEAIGKISVRERDSYVAVERKLAQVALETLGKGNIKGRSIKARLASLEASRPRSRPPHG